MTMAWRNQSYDAGAAGGWGEASFIGNDQSSDSQRTDKIPFPATVKDLSQITNNDEKITVGTVSFTTIRVVGRVKQSQQTGDGQSIEYILSDYHDESATFLIIHYKGFLDSALANSDAVVEGTDVSVVGKLRSFNDRLCVVAFDVREIEEKKEIDAFHLESRLAHLYYTKNVPELAVAGKLASLEDTMLRSIDTNADTKRPPTEASTSAGWSSGLQPNKRMLEQTHTGFGGMGGTYRGLTGQRAEIFKFLVNHGDAVIGAHLDDIKERIPRTVFNPRTFAADIEHLASEGLIYATSDDDHYAANT